MKMKLLGVALGAYAITLPAAATTTTVEYVIDGSDTQVWVYDESDMTFAGPDGVTGAFTLDEETGILCGDIDGQQVCVTFEVLSREAGHSTPFSTNDGRTGKATVLSSE